MSHMRIPTEKVISRANWAPRTGRAEYFFTLSELAAVKYIQADSGEELETYIDPNLVFPTGVMRQVEYAIKFGGIQCNVTEYRGVDNLPLGSILALISGAKPIGFYAINRKNYSTSA